MTGAFKEFRGATDPLAVWLEEHTLELPDASVAKAVLFQAYNAAARGDGQHLLSETAFSLSMKRLRPHLREGQRMAGCRRQRVWLGLGLKSDLESFGAARGARGLSNFNFSGERENPEEAPAAVYGSLEKQYKENPVNPVHPVQIDLSSTPQGTVQECGVDAASEESAGLRSDPWDSFLTEADA
jgi:hypothetical protein